MDKSIFFLWLKFWLVCRFIDLDIIIAVQDKPSEEQDINNALFDVVVPGRVYELMAHDEEEKIRY